MIEEELHREIHGIEDIPEEKCEESPIIRKEKCIKWHPVAEIYKDLPEVKRFHDSYNLLWLKNKGLDK